MNSIKYLFGFWLIFGFWTIANQSANSQSGFRLSGVVCDSTTQSPLEMVAVVVPEINRWSMTNESGYFEINGLLSGDYELTFQFLGYRQKHLQIRMTANNHLSVLLIQDNLKIKEILVTATENKTGSTASKIDASAMSHLQPSSIADIMELLPGYQSKKNNLSAVSSVSMRQAGSDINTSYGTSFIVDGIPVSNDANHQYSYGSSGDIKISDRINVRNGIDMRQLSTDDVERIEVIRGIPSVKYGDLLSGAVVLHSKSGAAPWDGRVKADLNTQLFSLSRGFKLNGHTTLNGSIEYLDYVSDPRTEYDNYRRITGSLRYANNKVRNNWRLYTKVGVSVLGTIDQSKNDPEINYGQLNKYRSSLTRYQGSVEHRLQFGENFSHQLRFNGSLSFSIDKLTRDRRVSLTGPTPMGINSEPGKYEGIYLPSTYMAHLSIDGKPMNLFVEASYATDFLLFMLKNQFETGVEWKTDKNYGSGEQFDQSRPPFPGSSYQLPRSFRSVPALHKMSFYLNDHVNVKFGQSKLAVEAGVRFTAIPGLNDLYQMHGRIYADPRLNARFDFPEVILAGDLVLKPALRAGFGRLSRMPSASHIYPAPVFHNVMELNYYSQNSDLRKLYIATFEYDMVNYYLEPAQNDKYELGLDLKVAKAQLQLTWFYEWCGNGFSSEMGISPYSYIDYDESSVNPEGLTAPPDLSLFSSKEVYKTMMLSRFGNRASIDKQGIEYALSFPEIKSIHTTISLNGAWFRTHYRTRGEGYDKPSVVINNEDYPYVAVYANELSDNRVRQQFNTNLLFVIHVPRYRLLGTIGIQNMWYTSSQYDAVSGLPVHYIDQYGNRHAFTQDMASDHFMSYMVKKFPEMYFKTSKVPIESTINLKLSKEIGEKLRLSFYVNNLYCYEPDYKSNYGVLVRRISEPYFGMEVNLKL